MNKKTLSYALERLLVLFLITTAITTFTLLIADFILRFANFTFYSWIVCVYMFFTGIVTQCISWIFLNEKTSVFANIRFIVFYEIIAFILFMFVIPGVPPMLIVVPTLFECYFILKLEGALSCHDDFIENCGDLTGQELASMLHEQNWLTSDFIEQLDDSLFKLGILSFIDFVFFLALFFTKTNLSVLTVLFLIAHAAFLIIMLILSSIYKNETYYAGMGLSSVFSIRNRLLKISLFFCAICIVAALLISSNYALLKPSYFAWLLGWLKNTKADGTMPTVPSAPEPQPSFLGDLPLDKIHVEENPIADIILAILKWAGIIGIVGGILFFFFGPFFSQKWKDFWKGKKLASYLKQIWATLRNALKALLGMRIKRGEAYAKAAADFKDKISTILEASKKSKEKKKEIDRLTSHFLKLIEWGEAREIPYKKNLAPAEYTALIADAFPAAEGLAAAAQTAGELFEKALYAKELLSPDEEKRFVAAVTEVTKSEKL